MIREYGPSELVDWGDPPASPDRASPDLASPDLASPDRASPDRASPGRARNALARAFQQQLGNPAPSPSDVSMRDAISVRSDNRSDNREPPPSQPSAQEGSRVQYTPGIVTHEGIRKRICGAFAAGRGHSLLLKFHSQNPDNPRLAAYDLVPVSEYRSAFAEYLSSGGQVLEKADINRLNAGDWPSLTIHGVASPRQNLGTSVDSHGNLYGDRPTNRVRAYILASTPTVSAEWYIQSELSRLFGAPQVVPAVQAHREKTGQYIPIEPSSSTVRNRRRPRGIELLQRATTQSALQNTALLSPNSPPPHSPHSPTPHSPRVDQMSDEQLTAYYDNVSRELRRRFRQSRGQPPSESTL
ncbi:MAG: hypothetical protein M1840_007212 [Geoglossum simile]|nr:MAG: hypothetical protein M1840_007212 [Geoglossum simile]